MATVPIDIPNALLLKAQTALECRGTTLPDFIRLQLKSLVRHSRHYALYDKMSFGKYEGEMMDTIIRADPDYITWCLREVAGFALTPEALDVLASTGVEL